MSAATLDFGLGGWSSDRDPEASEPNPVGYINYGQFFRNSAANTLWLCTNEPTIGQSGSIYTNDDIQWSFVCPLKNEPPQYQPVSLALNTARQPSTDYDIEVISTIILSSTLVTPESVDVQVDGGGGYVTIASLGLSGVIATSEQTVSFRVPVGQSYKIVTTSGSPVIGSICELPK